MSTIPFPFLIVWSLGAIFLVVGLVNIAGPRGLRATYARWEFPKRFYLVAGLLELTAALFLAIPEWRIWGIALAGFIAFGVVVTLFSHRRYLYAVPGIILMLALVPASLTVPHDTRLHYVHSLPAG